MRIQDVQITNISPYKLFEILEVARSVIEEDHPKDTRIRKLADYVYEHLQPLLENYGK